MISEERGSFLFVCSFVHVCGVFCISIEDYGKCLTLPLGCEAKVCFTVPGPLNGSLSMHKAMRMKSLP